LENEVNIEESVLQSQPPPGFEEVGAIQGNATQVEIISKSVPEATQSLGSGKVQETQNTVDALPGFQNIEIPSSRAQQDQDPKSKKAT